MTDLSTTTDEAGEATRRKRRTRAQIEADNAARQAVLDSDTVNTADFITILREWEKRYSACTDAERILQRTTGLKFMARAIDYETNNYDEDDRFTPRPDQPTEIPKDKIARAVKTVKRTHGTAYGINWLAKKLDDTFGVSTKQYNDTYTLTWKLSVTAQELEAWNWDGNESPAAISNALRYNRGINWREPNEFTIVPDPERAADAAARSARKAATAAAGTATPAPEPAKEETPQAATTTDQEPAEQSILSQRALDSFAEEVARLRRATASTRLADLASQPF